MSASAECTQVGVSQGLPCLSELGIRAARWRDDKLLVDLHHRATILILATGQTEKVKPWCNLIDRRTTIPG